MITALTILGCAFAYFQIGCWLGRLYWWTWHVNEKKNRILAYILFPFSAMFDDVSGAPVVDYAANRRGYLIRKGFLWPLSPLISVMWFVLIPLYFAGKAFLSGSWFPNAKNFLSFLFFSVVEGVTTSREKHYGKPAVAPVEEQVRVAPEVAVPESVDPLATDDDRARAARYKVLSARRDQLKTKLAPDQDELVQVEAEMAQIEAEDAAAHHPLRDPPQEMRLTA